MATLAKAHLPFFEVIASGGKQQCKSIMQSLNRGQVNAICEVLLNARYGFIEVGEEVKTKLKRKKSLIMLLTTKSSTLKERRAAITKHCAFIVSVLKELIEKIKQA